MHVFIFLSVFVRYVLLFAYILSVLKEDLSVVHLAHEIVQHKNVIYTRLRGES